MRNVFFSDLDKTLIFSGYKDKGYRCVDYRDDKEIAYMTEKAYTLINYLINLNDFSLIPTTLRTLSQTLEIDFINNYNHKYIICTNGAEIYVDKKLDLAWDKKMRELIKEEDIRLQLDNIEKLNIPLLEILNMNDFYIKLRFNSPSNADKWEEDIKKLLLKDYYLIKQSKLIFIMNINIKKEDAVKYLIEKYNFKNIYTAGDSSVDEMFTKIEGVKAYLPRHSTFKHNNTFISKDLGIYATEEILEELIKDLK